LIRDLKHVPTPTKILILSLGVDPEALAYLRGRLSERIPRDDIFIADCFTEGVTYNLFTLLDVCDTVVVLADLSRAREHHDPLNPCPGYSTHLRDAIAGCMRAGRAILVPIVNPLDESGYAVAYSILTLPFMTIHLTLDPDDRGNTFEGLVQWVADNYRRLRADTARATAYDRLAQIYETWRSSSRNLQRYQSVELPRFDRREKSFEDMLDGVFTRRAVQLDRVESATKDVVTASVFAPPSASPGDSVMVQVFAHLREDEGVVGEMAREFDSDAVRRAKETLGEGVERGARLWFNLTMPGLAVDEPDQFLVWRGAPEAVQFGVTVPPDFKPRNVVGTVLVIHESVPIGHLKFVLKVAVGQGGQGGVGQKSDGRYVTYQSAFISYASEDRAEVMPRVQALAAAKIEVFMDVVELEPGERWEKGLYKRIDDCDVFFLFWSTAAKESEWVRKEVTYARHKKGDDEKAPPEIIPIIIEGPPPVEPPPGLHFLHFNDKYIYLMKGIEAEAEARLKAE
jgi:hypothetical protein